MTANKKLTLGSLFSGSGGFELGGLLTERIEPVWNCEVEPFCIRVTTKRLPNVKHYGDISSLDGSEIEPVDIITGGFPCQSVSIAGHRDGIQHIAHGGDKTTRSGLFYEAIRIVEEMRESTNGKYPRFMVIENVQGLFSSNKGEDFKAVLESLCKVKSANLAVPKPQNGKWDNAGCILGEDFSLAWRLFDAQYWGVPQRRKRIYLVADFDGGCAGKILFESEGVSGYSPQGFRSWQAAAGSTEESVGTSSLCLNDQGGQRMDVTEDVTCTLRAESHHPPCVIGAAGFCTEHSADSRGIGYETETSPTLRAGAVPATVYENHSQDTRYTGPVDVAPTVLSTYGTGGNNQPFVVETPKCFDVRFTSEGTKNARQNCYETNTSRTIDTGGNAPDSNQGGVAIVAYGICSKSSNAMLSDNPKSGFYKADTSRCLDGNGSNPSCNQGGMAVIEGNGTRPSHKGDGYKKSDIMYTLNATEQHAVAYGIDRAAFNQGRNAKFDFNVTTEVEPPMVAQGANAVAQPTYSTSKNSHHTIAEKELANTLVASDYKDPPSVNALDDNAKYIVRRLTPTECARLQGFPDWWCADLGTENPTEEDIAFWTEVFETHRKVIGKTTKPKTEKQIIKWLKNPHSDSAEYKMWGNGVALPNVCFVLAGIVYYSQETTE